MMTPDEQYRADSRAQMDRPRRASRWRRTRAVPLAALTSMLLAAGATQAMAAPGPDAATGETAGTDGTAVPGVSATDGDWQEWSADLFAEARETDWTADSAARGCELISVDIVRTTVPEGTFAGAPAGLEVPAVERVEDCSSALASAADEGTSTTTALAARASTCRSTSGPGTICLSRSGNYLTASFTYRGSGSIDGFIRVYERSSSSGCGTGATIATFGERSYNYGTRHSYSTYQPGYGHYSAAFWKDAWWGHQNLGMVCRSI